ncbi:hypothetical protein PVK06_018913 [Gossypium arboreum]|uniref:Uncharacterized protein n=1 Tax=Gossypium arboreum TaxID=29729 RepID=A0ABR0PIA9_GOSAR|nr:hypothetical protein PVK06_018913 [Gossypium arboreum]
MASLPGNDPSFPSPSPFHRFSFVYYLGLCVGLFDLFAGGFVGQFLVVDEIQAELLLFFLAYWALSCKPVSMNETSIDQELIKLTKCNNNAL